MRGQLGGWVDEAVGAAARPIVQYWDAGEPPAYLDELLSSFSALNPDLPHLVFDEVEARRLIAVHFTEREVAAFSACAVPAMQSDYFRYCAILIRGGVWADVDFRCKRSLRPLIDGSATARLFGYPTKRAFEGEPIRVVTNSFIAFRSPAHPLLRLALDLTTAHIEARVTEDVWVITGPGIFTALKAAHQLGSFAAFATMAAGTRLEPSATLLPEVVRYERIAEAFTGVLIHPADERRIWAEGAGKDLPYKRTGSHWVEWEKGPKSIFR